MYVKCDKNHHLPSILLPHFLAKSTHAAVQLYIHNYKILLNDQRRLLLLVIKQICSYFSRTVLKHTASEMLSQESRDIGIHLIAQRSRS